MPAMNSGQSGRGDPCGVGEWEGIATVGGSDDLTMGEYTPQTPTRDPPTQLGPTGYATQLVHHLDGVRHLLSLLVGRPFAVALSTGPDRQAATADPGGLAPIWRFVPVDRIQVGGRR